MSSSKKTRAAKNFLDSLIGRGGTFSVLRRPSSSGVKSRLLLSFLIRVGG
jgi:hypothetical protein